MANKFLMAMRQADTYRGHLRAKGFTRKAGSGDLIFTRGDADLRYDGDADRWVCDVFTVVDGKRAVLFTRKAAPMLLTVLKSVL